MLEIQTTNATKPGTRSPVEVLGLDLDAYRMEEAVSVETIPAESSGLVRELVMLEDGARYERIQVDSVFLWIACG